MALANGLSLLDSFDDLATADLPGKWTNAVGASIVAAAGRNGTQSLRFSAGTGTEALSVTLQTTAQKAVGFAWRRSVQPAAANQIVQFTDTGTVQLAVQVNADGTLSVLRGGTLLSTTSFALAVSTYYYIEFKATIGSGAAGSYDLRVNSVSRTSGTGVNTQNTASATMNGVKLCNTNSSGSYQQDYDDVYICEGASTNFLGDIRVVVVRPDSAGNYSQFTPSTGSNWQNVDDVTPTADTDYNETTLTTAKDTYGFSAVGFTGTVLGVQLNLRVRNSDANPSTCSGMLRIGGTDYVGSTVHSPGAVYQQFRQVFENSPSSGTNFTTAEIDGMEAGISRLS